MPPIADYDDGMTTPARTDAEVLSGDTVPQFAPPKAICPTELHPGQSIDDFDLLARLGQGSFARVFLARQRTLQRLVALKVSADHGTEPQTLAQLDHPHIVRVYDQRVIRDCGLRLLYMPYLAGGTLKDVIAHVRAAPAAQRSGKLLLAAVDAVLTSRGELPPTDSSTRAKIAAMTWPETVAWLGARLAEALDYAHRQGVLHRDLKPANVLLGSDATPRLADFNVSSCSHLEGTDAAACFGGSLGYMSPEQLEAYNPKHDRQPADLDGRSDVYSLALTLYEVLTGERPFASDEPDGDVPTISKMIARRYEDVTVRLVKLPADLPEGLADVLTKALTGDRDQRYTSAAEMARQLDLCLKPRSRRLLLPAPGWRTWVARHPMLSLFTVGLVPNILAALFSIEYNGTNLVEKYPAISAMFHRLILILNGVFFPLCVALFGWILWPVARGLRRAAIPESELAALRRRCVFLGPLSVAVCLWAWVAAGVIFPLAMHLGVHDLPANFHLHFLASQTLCGLIAVSYPQFGVTFLALRALYPRFVPNATLSAPDLADLRRIDRIQSVFLMLAASIPMLAVGLLASIGGESRFVLGILSAVGLLGFFLSYWLTNEIHSDCLAYQDAMAK